MFNNGQFINLANGISSHVAGTSMFRNKGKYKTTASYAVPMPFTNEFIFSCKQQLRVSAKRWASSKLRFSASFVLLH